MKPGERCVREAGHMGPAHSYDTERDRLWSTPRVGTARRCSFVQPPSSDTGSPGVCAAWCGMAEAAVSALRPPLPERWLGIKYAYCSPACRDACRPLNPAPSTTVAMGPLDEFRAAYRDVGNVGPGPWTAAQMRRFWKAAEVLAACGGVLTLGVTSPSAGQEAAKPRGSDEGAAGKAPASPAIPRAREVANDWLSPTKLDIPANVRDLDVLAALIEARDAAVRAATLEEAAALAETACSRGHKAGGHMMFAGCEIAARIRSLKGSGT